MKTNFLFVKWYAARHKLVKLLELNSRQAKILNDWFHHSLVEIGVTYQVGRELLKQVPDKEDKNFKGWVKRKLAHQLAEQIMEENLFDLEQVPTYRGMEYRARALLAMTPDFVGPARFSSPTSSIQE